MTQFETEDVLLDEIVAAVEASMQSPDRWADGLEDICQCVGTDYLLGAFLDVTSSIGGVQLRLGEPRRKVLPDGGPRAVADGGALPSVEQAVAAIRNGCIAATTDQKLEDFALRVQSIWQRHWRPVRAPARKLFTALAVAYGFANAYALGRDLLFLERFEDDDLEVPPETFKDYVDFSTACADDLVLKQFCEVNEIAKMVGISVSEFRAALVKLGAPVFMLDGKTYAIAGVDKVNTILDALDDFAVATVHLEQLGIPVHGWLRRPGRDVGRSGKKAYRSRLAAKAHTARSDPKG